MRLMSLTLSLLITCAAHAELTIFDVQRNLPMFEGEKVYHDYYVDSGAEAGLKTGMVLTVQRKQSLFDYYRNREVADLQLSVAKVRVIQVQDNLSVVRLKDEISREDAPISDDHYIMIGDRLDLASLGAVATETPAPVAVTPVVIPVVAPAATPVITAKTAAPEPAPAAQIVVNSVDLSVEEPKNTQAPPVAEPKPTVK